MGNTNAFATHEAIKDVLVLDIPSQSHAPSFTLLRIDTDTTQVSYFPAKGQEAHIARLLRQASQTLDPVPLGMPLAESDWVMIRRAVSELAQVLRDSAKDSDSSAERAEAKAFDALYDRLPQPLSNPGWAQNVADIWNANRVVEQYQGEGR